eukprot:10042421-Alexandrium_andersonii.AAC.1
MQAALVRAVPEAARWAGQAALLWASQCPGCEKAVERAGISAGTCFVLCLVSALVAAGLVWSCSKDGGLSLIHI